MSSAAAAAGGAPSDDRVYRAVAAGWSVNGVRHAIERSQSAAAAVNQAGANGQTPLGAARGLYKRNDLVCLLLENGAEGAEDSDWFEAVNWCVHKNDLVALRRLIERGVSVNTADVSGFTPLIWACFHSRRTANRRDVTLEVLRRSSAETRRAVSNSGLSAVDWFFAGAMVLPIQPWHAELVVELLAAGAPVQPRNAVRSMPLAAARAARREAELAACRSMGHDWRAQHETFVRLSLDMGEMREAERAVMERRALLAMLELTLSSGTDSGSSSGSSSGSESDSESESGSGSDSESEEDEEATGSGGGGGEVE